MEKDVRNVFSGSAMQADLVEQLLTSNGVRCIVVNRLMGAIIPASGGNAVDVRVEAVNYEKACGIIEAYKNELEIES